MLEASCSGPYRFLIAVPDAAFWRSKIEAVPG
jgi:hypothetical protein